MRGAAIWLGLAVLPTLAAAQEPPASARLLAEFAASCVRTFADPRATINEIADQGGIDTRGSITSDGARATIDEWVTFAPDVKGSGTFRQIVAGGKALQSCSLFVLPASALAAMYDDMAEVADAQAEAILGGPAIRAGDPVGSRPSPARRLVMFVWSRVDEAPNGLVLTLDQWDGRFGISIDRIVPAP